MTEHLLQPFAISFHVEIPNLVTTLAKVLTGGLCVRSAGFPEDQDRSFAHPLLLAKSSAASLPRNIRMISLIPAYVNEGNRVTSLHRVHSARAPRLVTIYCDFVKL